MSKSTTLNKVAGSLWFEISDWFTSARYFNEDSFVTRLRYFQITAFSFLFITSFLNFLDNSVTCYIITSISCFFLIIVRYLLDNNKIKEAYLLMLCSINLALILLTFVEGVSSGVFLFFFPTSISFSFLTDLSNKKNVMLTYGVGISSFFLAVAFAPDSILFKGTWEGINEFNFFLNIVLSFLLVLWMSYSLARENFRKQTMLKNKEVFLNTIFNSSLHTALIVDKDSG